MGKFIIDKQIQGDIDMMTNEQRERVFEQARKARENGGAPDIKLLNLEGRAIAEAMAESMIQTLGVERTEQMLANSALAMRRFKIKMPATTKKKTRKR